MHEKQFGNETKHHLQWEYSLGWYCDDEMYWSHCWSAYLLTHRNQNSVFANITAIGMTDCPAYGKTTQHQQEESVYLTLRQSASHQDEGHSLNDSQSDAYENWIFFFYCFFFLLNLKYLPYIMMTKQMTMSLLPTLYIGMYITIWIMVLYAKHRDIHFFANMVGICKGCSLRHSKYRE